VMDLALGFSRQFLRTQIYPIIPLPAYLTYSQCQGS
jgi:hypothetical protein